MLGNRSRGTILAAASISVFLCAALVGCGKATSAYSVNHSTPASVSGMRGAAPTVARSDSATGATPVGSVLAGSPTTAPNTSVGADPTKVIDAAWLTAPQMPDDDFFHWSRPATATVSQDPSMFGMGRIFPMCVAFDPGPKHSKWTGAQELDFTGKHGSASQIIMIYPDVASAHAAYQMSLDSCRGFQDLTRSWQAHPLGTATGPVDAIVTQTATTADGSAWSRHWTGSDGPSSAAGVQTNHQYIVQRGPVLTAVSFDEGPGPSAPSTAYDTAGDGQILTTIASELCHYGGLCS